MLETPHDSGFESNAIPRYGEDYILSFPNPLILAILWRWLCWSLGTFYLLLQALAWKLTILYMALLILIMWGCYYYWCYSLSLSLWMCVLWWLVLCMLEFSGSGLILHANFLTWFIPRIGHPVYLPPVSYILIYCGIVLFPLCH